MPRAASTVLLNCIYLTIKNKRDRGAHYKEINVARPKNQRAAGLGQEDALLPLLCICICTFPRGTDRPGHLCPCLLA